MEKQDIESMLKIPEKLKWACRRGMLELDVLLTNFVAKGYNSLSDENKRLFIELLSLPDPELFALLMEHKPAINAEQQALIKRIRLCT